MKSFSKKTVPHSWFAWRPVIARGRPYWLCRIYRTWLPLGGGIGDGFWIYEPIVSQRSEW